MKKDMDIDLAVLYITDKASDEEKKQFEEWLNQSESNIKEYKEWKTIWDITGKNYHNFSPDKNEGWNKIKQRTGNLKNNRNIWYNNKRIYRIAASVALLIISGLIIIMILNSNAGQDARLLSYESGSDTLTVHLQDGTEICLNRYSEIKVPELFSNSKREVYIKGEAYFIVHKDPGSPFRIHTQNTITEVLGTSFNLKSTNTDVNVALYEGKVAFYKNGIFKDKIILTPGQQGSYNTNTHKIIKDSISDINLIAWKTGKLQFNHTSTGDLCKTLSKYYNAEIIIEPGQSSSGKGNFTGSFNNLSLSEVLNIIELTMDIKVIYNDSNIILKNN